MYGKTIQKMEAVRTLTDNGTKTKDALEMVGYGKKSISSMQTRFKNYLLTTPKLLSKSKTAAEKIFDDFIEERVDNKGNQCDAKHALRLIELQQERIDPVVNKHLVQSQSLNISVTQDQRSDIIRSLRRYKGSLPPDMECESIIGDSDNGVIDV